MFEISSFEAYDAKMIDKRFNKIKQTIFKSDSQQYFKVIPSVISVELGSNLNEYVHVVARKKMIPSLQSLTDQNKGKL